MRRGESKTTQSIVYCNKYKYEAGLHKSNVKVLFYQKQMVKQKVALLTKENSLLQMIPFIKSE